MNSDGSGLGVAASEPRGIIIEKFARWTAASAARQGCEVRGAKWYEHLDSVDLASLLALAPVTRPLFLAWHQGEVQKVAASADVPIGWAAKMVNMLTKVHVYIARRGDASLLAFIHPPIDGGLVAAVRRDFPLKGPKQ